MGSLVYVYVGACLWRVFVVVVKCECGASVVFESALVYG